jgi:hypothetical protein
MGRKKVPLDGAEVERLRQVRRNIERKYKTHEALVAYLQSLEKGNEINGPRVSSKATVRKTKIARDAVAEKPSRPSVRK